MIGSRLMRYWVLIIALAGCGPIIYVNESTRRASTAVDEARAAEADKYAPYYWTRATEYLRKSRELAAHADMQEANRYARLSSEAAELALEEAMKLRGAPGSKAPAKEPAPAPAKDDKPLAPAKDDK